MKRTGRKEKKNDVDISTVLYQCGEPLIKYLPIINKI